MVAETADLMRQIAAVAGEYHRLKAQTRQAQHQLYGLLRTGVTAGFTYTEVGSAAGLSRTRVKQVVNDGGS